MSRETDPATSRVADEIQVDLRQPGVAAFWAWLWPGAGHFYQRRYAKGALFMICILGTYFFGLAIGGGHVVYANWKVGDRRWQYLCQLGVGLPALPAMVQYYRGAAAYGQIMAPPGDVQPERFDQLAEWHERYHGFFELGTLYTMVAGLLNVLAIYDAYAGPLVPTEETDRPPPEKGEGGDRTEGS